MDVVWLRQFLALAGPRVWRARLEDIRRQAGASRRAGRMVLQRHAIELAIERLRQPDPGRPPSDAEIRVAALVAETMRTHEALGEAGRIRLREQLATALTARNTLVPLFHLMRSAALQRARGFTVHHAGLNDGTPFDLLITRDGSEAELACDVISAEDGRGMHRGAWFHLVDRIDPDLQTWLAAHPGRYLLKMTLPQGLRCTPPDCGQLPILHRRIRAMLDGPHRADHDEAAILRLDPLLLAGAQADELGLLSHLRHEFGPEAHLAVTASGGGVFAMAARAGQENAVAAAIRRRLATIAPTRLTGQRPGILAMFVEDTDRTEWRTLRDNMELEGETRQFLTHPDARRVVAVTCTSRLELFGLHPPDTRHDGELRFRNPTHPAAKSPALAPAVLSSI